MEWQDITRRKWNETEDDVPSNLWQATAGPLILDILNNHRDFKGQFVFHCGGRGFRIYDTKPLGTADLEEAKERAENLLMNFIHDVVQGIGGE